MKSKELLTLWVRSWPIGTVSVKGDNQMPKIDKKTIKLAKIRSLKITKKNYQITIVRFSSSNIMKSGNKETV